MTQAALNALIRDWIPMRPSQEAAWRRALPLARIRRAGGLVLLAIAAAWGVTAPARAAQPFIWDQDGNGIDDRIESVHALGWSASFELGDTTLRQRIQVLQGGPELVYAVYVVWKQTPTPGDLAQLAFIGMPALTRIEAVPATRSVAT